MPKTLAPALLALLIAIPAAAQVASPGTGIETPAEDASAEAEIPTRPGANPDQYPVSDSLAECGAAMIAASNVSNSRIERQNLMAASGAWLSAAADVSIREGREQPIEVVFEKTEAWMSRIGAVSALGQRHGDWMTYCAHLAADHGLDGGLFDRQRN